MSDPRNLEPEEEPGLNLSSLFAFDKENEGPNPRPVE